MSVFKTNIREYLSDVPGDFYRETIHEILTKYNTNSDFFELSTSDKIEKFLILFEKYYSNPEYITFEGNMYDGEDPDLKSQYNNGNNEIYEYFIGSIIVDTMREDIINGDWDVHLLN